MNIGFDQLLPVAQSEVQYMWSIFDANMISLLNLTPRIVRKQSCIVRQIIDPSDWVKLSTMQDPMTMVATSQWIRVRNGTYKEDFGFVTDVEAFGAQVLVIPPSPQDTNTVGSYLAEKKANIYQAGTNTV